MTKERLLKALESSAVGILPEQEAVPYISDSGDTVTIDGEFDWDVLLRRLSIGVVETRERS